MKYKVTLKELRVHVYEQEIEAESEHQARDIAGDEAYWDEVDDYYSETLSMDVKELED